MKTLFIDLASHSGVLACVTEDAILAFNAIDHRIDDAALVPSIEELLKKAGWSYADLTNIACVVGPGGFTSLRVAVALVNTLGNELEIPVCGIHLSDMYELRIKNKELRIVWVHSTKKNELFIRESASSEARCITVDELKAILKKGTLWMGELIPEQQAIVAEAGVASAVLTPLEEVLPAFLKTQPYSKRMLSPWYGRGW